MASTKWPLRSDFRQIGRRTQRLDGPAKVTGLAKYALRHQPPGDADREDRLLPARTRQSGEYRHLGG